MAVETPNLVSLQLVTSMAAEPLLLSLERHNSSIDDEVGLRPYVYAIGPHGLIARWRGSALAWPLIDAMESKDGVLCALHRGDSFLMPDPAIKTTRIAAYRWNGFGLPASKLQRNVIRSFVSPRHEFRAMNFVAASLRYEQNRCTPKSRLLRRWIEHRDLAVVLAARKIVHA